MYKFISIMSMALMASGCVSINKQPLDAKSSQTLKNQSVATTNRNLPNFAAMTPGKAAFAIVGAAAMIAEGNKIIAENDVKDPADTIAAELTKSLETSYGAKIIAAPVKVNDDDVQSVISTAKGVSKYLLDVQTINWNFAYFPTDWTHYRVMYTAKARLIDAESKNVIAEGFCKRIPDSNTNAPTYDELLQNNAERLKKELNAAAQECIKNLKSEMLAA